MPTTIYTLSDPLSGEVRYVGKTLRTLRERLRQHVSQKHYRGHVGRWITKLGKKPVITAIVIVEDSLGSETEIAMIELHRKQGYRLTNITLGGEGWLGVKWPEERRQRYLGHTWGFKKGHQMTPEERADQIALMRGNQFAVRKHSAEETARRAASLRRTLAVKYDRLIEGDGWEAFPLNRESIRRLRREQREAHALGVPFVRHLALRG